MAGSRQYHRISLFRQKCKIQILGNHGEYELPNALPRERRRLVNRTTPVALPRGATVPTTRPSSRPQTSVTAAMSLNQDLIFAALSRSSLKRQRHLRTIHKHLPPPLPRPWSTPQTNKYARKPKHLDEVDGHRYDEAPRDRRELLRGGVSDSEEPTTRSVDKSIDGSGWLPSGRGRSRHSREPRGS